MTGDLTTTSIVPAQVQRRGKNEIVWIIRGGGGGGTCVSVEMAEVDQLEVNLLQYLLTIVYITFSF